MSFLKNLFGSKPKNDSKVYHNAIIEGKKIYNIL